LKNSDALTVFFVIYIVGLSFVPLIHQTLLSENAWLGYGTGAYALQSPHYFILFNDPYDGSSKPNIHINPTFAPNARISLIEFSDWTSWVDGYNLFNDFNVTIRPGKPALDVTYTRPGITIHKFVEVSPDGNSVTVKLVANKGLAVHLELWKWVMSSVNDISAAGVTKPLVIPTTTAINYTFQYQPLNALGSASILLSRVPSQIEVWPFEDGFNKITVDFVNSEMSLTVSGTMSTTTTPTFNWDYADLPYVLPTVAILVVALYLLVGKYGKHKKGRSRSSRS
jgi:hypothetical protein